jgi:subtilase family protein
MSHQIKRAAMVGAVLFFASNSGRAAPGALGGGLEQMVQAYEQGSENLSFTLRLHLRDANGDPLVRFRLADGRTLKDVLPQLNALGFKLVAQSKLDPRLVEGYLPLGSARFSVTLSGINSAVAVHVPMKHAGKVESQAVALQKADQVIAGGIDGTGIKLGALSDSFDACTVCSTHAAQDEASGDLPPTVTVLEDIPNGTGEDEGRAMLQLVHDMAPGAQLAFATAFVSEVDFSNNILALRSDFHADVITDDVVYFDEPMYSDGLLAQSVDVVASEGAAYFSSAGNNGLEAYEGTYTPVSFAAAEALTAAGKQNLKVDQIPAAQRPLSFHNFGGNGGVANLANRLSVAADDVIDFQWDEPFNLGKVKTDYDIFIFDANGNWLDPATAPTIFATNDDNIAVDQAIELAELIPFPGEIHGAVNDSDYQFAIGKRNSGPANRIKYVVVNALGVSKQQGAPSIFGHTAAAKGQSVAAMYYAITNFPEDFSAQGPVTILFDNDGNRLKKADVRPVPQITAGDGVDTTFFPPGGGDPDLTGFPNFFGTSAAAPDAAGVAALMLQAAGGPGSLTPDRVYKEMQGTATRVRLAKDRTTASGVAGPVAISLSGDFVRLFHYFGVGVQPGVSGTVSKIAFDVTNTPTGLTWSQNPNRFNVDPAGDVAQAQVTPSVSPDSKVLTLTFAPTANFGGGKSFHFGESVFTPIEGTTQEDPDRFRGMNVTVTFSTGAVFTGTIFTGELSGGENPFTGAGLVNASEAVRHVARNGKGK